MLSSCPFFEIRLLLFFFYFLFCKSSSCGGTTMMLICIFIRFYFAIMSFFWNSINIFFIFMFFIIRRKQNNCINNILLILYYTVQHFWNYWNASWMLHISDSMMRFFLWYLFFCITTSHQFRPLNTYLAKKGIYPYSWNSKKKLNAI